MRLEVGCRLSVFARVSFRARGLKVVVIIGIVGIIIIITIM